MGVITNNPVRQNCGAFALNYRGISLEGTDFYIVPLGTVDNFQKHFGLHECSRADAELIGAAKQRSGEKL